MLKEKTGVWCGTSTPVRFPMGLNLAGRHSAVICGIGKRLIHPSLIFCSYPVIFPGLLVRGLIPLFSPWDTILLALFQSGSGKSYY
ncbi:unnamed protein product [Arabis nemorensis]|uniref:Uncharacterized protein n=1 Tax=Arabis nemorensis TaxID=586526 RepID=A0A565CHY6_9BRAS|nr:unnamed protein product [Arabis nemorensis]